MQTIHIVHEAGLRDLGSGSAGSRQTALGVTLRFVIFGASCSHFVLTCLIKIHGDTLQYLSMSQYSPEELMLDWNQCAS